jgi:nucleoside triphosphate pyrophosphatase
MNRLVLASSSPRRALLLGSAGFTFDQIAPPVDEASLEDETPEARVVRLARSKALAVDEPDAVALGADTEVVLDGVVMGKPADEQDAVRMLMRLSGRTHIVVTGWALAESGVIIEDGFEATLVTMGNFGREEAEAYVAGGEAMGKTGAYAIQGDGKRFVTGVAGPRSTVIGLPLEAVVAALARAGISPWAPI